MQVPDEEARKHEKYQSWCKECTNLIQPKLLTTHFGAICQCDRCGKLAVLALVVVHE